MSEKSTILNPKLICFYGPESTGKSNMAKRLANAYATEFVPEVAREIVSSNQFTENDIIRIGHAQTQRVLDKMKVAHQILFCDSDLITTQIYSNHYLGVIPPVLFELEKQVVYNDYFFFDIDTEWVSDGLRDLGTQREYMKHTFLKALHDRNIHYHLLQGTWQEKEHRIRTILKNKWNIVPPPESF